MVRNRKKKSGSFRRRALKAARLRKAKLLRARANTYAADRVRLDRGGYDQFGKYFGQGAPLYEVESVDENKYGFVRANSAEEARLEAVTRPHHWGIRNFH